MLGLFYFGATIYGNKTTIINVIKDNLTASYKIVRTQKLNIFLIGLFCLLNIALLGVEKSVKFGSGYKAFTLNTHKSLIHSGRYFYGGYSYEFGDKFKNKVQFQVSNSNREINLDLPYISAATAINIYYDWTIKTVSFKNSMHFIGANIGNDFNLNFFPKLDNKNFLIFNQSFFGLSMMSKFNLKNNSRVDFNTHIPIYSIMAFSRVDRFSSENPDEKTVNTYSGFAKKLFNSNAELGYLFPKFGLIWGIYYQYEINKFEKKASSKLYGEAHSLSLRIIY